MTNIAALKNTKVRLLGCLVSASVFMLPVSHATSPSPVVTGNTISVIADGWYQFQNSDSFESLCSGTFECTVPAGSYIVINHTTQERWESVLVQSQASTVIPFAEGLTFTFSDDAWYQVQDSVSYQSVCNGMARCTVAAGSYNVINHTSGQRWEAIAVSDSNDSNTFLLPDKDWYQVQSTANYSSFCEGATRCIVPAGEYNVINLTNGSRYEGILLGSLDPLSPLQPSLSFSAANAEDIVRNVISVINEDQIDAFFENAKNDLGFQGRLFYLTNTVDDIVFSQVVDLETPYRLETNFGVGTFTDIPVRSEYTCAAGGTIYGYLTDRVFNDCAVGDTIYNGTSGRRNDNLRGTIRNYPFWSFSSTDSTGNTSTLTGGYSTGNLSFLVLNQVQRWTDTEFTTTLNDGAFRLSDLTIERLDRSDLSSGFDTMTRVVDGVPYTIRNNSRSSSINGSFAVAAAWTNQDLIGVNVSLTFSDTVRALVDTTITDYPGTLDPIEPFEWQAGSIEITAPDGSHITVTPTAAGSQSFSVVLSNGESIGPLMWSEGFRVDCASTTICGE